MNAIFLSALKRSGLGEEVLQSAKRVVLGREGLVLGVDYRTCSVPGDLKPEDLMIRYQGTHDLVSFSGEALVKPLKRFDFREEWNNRGYGAVTLDSESEFSLGGFFRFTGVEVVAEVVHRKTGESICDYAWIKNSAAGSTLWFNRAVGPVDGYDWVVVENFYSRYRSEDLPCYPVVSEIPNGFDAAVTMRIDCDEAVASGRRLFELYRELKMPFSMAIKTNQPLQDADRDLMRDVIQAGGSIVGHSHTHAANWGGSRESAVWEIKESHRVLREQGVDGINYDYVVSPFHQNPLSAIQGLRDAGIRGFVGGIICNDPEYLIARAGHVPFVDGVITHSEQCMLHGETYHQAGNSLLTEKQAFTQAIETKTFFGYLDHPFSNYWYGWDSEEERLAAHREYVEFIGSHKSIWKASLAEALRFLEMKASLEIEISAGIYTAKLPRDARFGGLPGVVVHRSGKSGEERYVLKPGEEVRIEL